ncbi:MAG: UDP-2,3-diacylglucosamine diphosphatase LpxI [Akkermansia sp.]|nr:UDP-2,3-diacylglucosamine diphosphatase LpxI [Akkermansia sp.]
MQDIDPSKHVLGVLAGAGEYPKLMIEGAKRAGMRVVCIGFRGAVSKDIPPLCDAFRKFRVGALEGPLAYFKSQGVTHVVLTGQIKPACIYTMWPDATARRWLAELDRRNAHTIFGAVCRYIQENGMQVLPSTAFMEEVLPEAGHLAGPAPTPTQREEAAHGLQLAREIARLDIGQSLIVRGNEVTCVEAYKGTNECIKNGGGSPESPVTLCKVTKPGHDMRFDVPCIGLRTIEHCARCGVSHIVFEAKRTILFQKQAVIDLCNRHSITLHAMDIPAGGIMVDDLGEIPDDAAHATEIANALEKLHIGHSAIVCEGVVIAVEDPQGPLKCIQRAGAYMKRIRFIRLTNWLVRVLLGRNSSPPAPMIMRGSAHFAPTQEIIHAARKAGIKLD